MASPFSLKPGLRFVETPTGAIVLDVAGDRFVALRTLSAALWSRRCHGASWSTLLHYLEGQGFDPAASEQLLTQQVAAWRRAGLVDAESGGELPLARDAGGSSPPAAFPCTSSWPTLRSVASLALAERRYRLLLRHVGLATALVRLQRELRPHPPRDPHLTVSRALGAYHVLRRPFRQGVTARDCLPRSLALVAVLRDHGLDAHLCLGIVDMPFQSHAWAEWNGFVLNEDAELVASYLPIARF